MSEIVLFSGTTEGRNLSELLSQAKINHLVCVASEYGMVVMEDDDYADIRVGRLDIEGMKKLFLEECGESGIIVDATHPYATEVTNNIKTAVRECGLQYIRVIRDRHDMEELNMNQDKLINSYKSAKEMAKAINNILSETNDNILLTTGSKELYTICEKLDTEQKQRVYVRILPAIESLKICQDNGIAPGHIIAMQGPFSKDMNMALIKQYDIKHLVTKESGVTGGFDEKISAARELGVTCHIIAREDEQGVHVKEAFDQIAGQATIQCGELSASQPTSKCGEQPACQATSKCGEQPAGKRNITLVGRGMGTADTMTKEVTDIIAGADAVFGATRLIKDISCNKKYDMYRAEDIIPVLEKDTSIENAVVIFSGDSGFFSGAANMKEKLESVATVDIKCGISSVSYFASKLGKAYSDAYIGSVHGRNELVNINCVADKIVYSKRSFVLLSGAADVRSLAKKIGEILETNCQTAVLSLRIVVGTNLSYRDETIEELSLDEAVAFDREGVMVAYIDNPDAPARPLINVFRDDAFERDKVPMTKECVRHESIIALNLKQGDVVYDIGGGTGSVAIEIAKLNPGLKVYTIEKKLEAIELIEKNVAKHGADNVTVVRGEAPGALAQLEPADAVFIGGSSGHMAEILECIRYRKSGVRVVINAVSFETINEVNELLKTIDVSDVRALQLAVTDIKEIGNYHMMQANNPVMIYSFIMN